MKPAARNILLGQLLLYCGLFACTLLKPSVWSVNNGISYFGIYRKTFFPYALGLLGAAYFAVRAIDQLPVSEKVLRSSLKIYAPLIVGIVITPYAAGRWMDYLHTACGSALFSLQLVLSGYLIWRLAYTWWAILLTLIQVGAGLLSAFYLSPTHGFLFQAQIVFQLAFGLLLTLSLQRIAQAATQAA